MKRLLFAIVLLLSINSVNARYHPVVYTPYVPTHSTDDVMNVTLSGCSPPGTVTGCASCKDTYPELFKRDCIYYFGSRPSDCSVVYDKKSEKNTCIRFMFDEKIKDPAEIKSTCQLLDMEKYNQDFCINGLALQYGDDKICVQIEGTDERARNTREGCYRDFADKDHRPELCSNVQYVDAAIDCCMVAKYEIDEQYTTSRQDLIDAYITKHGQDKIDECKKLLKIKSAAKDGPCEDVNCECLKPCNDVQGEAQNKCAQDCAKTYTECYDKKRQEMTQESRDRYMQQSFFGTFSRKHCAEYQGLAGALKTVESHKVVETSECTTSDECGERRVCSVCGRCQNEERSVAPSDVKVAYKLNADQTEQKIKNIINENAVFRVTVDRKLTAKDKSISYCDIAMPGLPKDVKLNAVLAEPDLFAGFTTGHITDLREPTQSCSIDMSQDSKKCVFIVTPNDRKKPVGLVKDITHTIGLFMMQGNNVLNAKEDALKLTLLASGPTLNFKMGTPQMQQGTVKGIRFDVDDKDTPLISVKAKVIGPGELFETTKKDITLSSLTFTADPRKEIEFGYQAPELGNFDIGQALNSLSMWDLQKEAAKSIAKDVLLAGADIGLDRATEAVKGIAVVDQAALSAYKKYIQAKKGFQTADKSAKYVMSASKARQFEADFGNLVNTYKFGKGVINDLPGINSGIKDTTESIGVNVDNAQGGRATTTETIANVGITGINILQLGVGVLTYVPNKIPGAGKLTAGVQAAFSAATNIWKANLQYIAQDEKIGRAQELFAPVMVMVVVEDLSGWQTTSTVTLQVAYQQV